MLRCYLTGDKFKNGGEWCTASANVLHVQTGQCYGCELAILARLIAKFHRGQPERGVLFMILFVGTTVLQGMRCEDCEPFFWRVRVGADLVGVVSAGVRSGVRRWGSGAGSWGWRMGLWWRPWARTSPAPSLWPPSPTPADWDCFEPPARLLLSLSLSRSLSLSLSLSLTLSLSLSPSSPSPSEQKYPEFSKFCLNSQGLGHE
jgi:hypothetical protein